MRHPRIGQNMGNKDKYWEKIDHSIDKWCFDFISIHKMDKHKYSLGSPLCLVDKTGQRPDFENKIFKIKKLAINEAKVICFKYPDKQIFIVECSFKEGLK